MTHRNRFFLILGILLTTMTVQAGNVQADTAEQMYYSAENYYQKFLKNSKQMKYRDNWFECIRKFEGAYRKKPSGRLAPASLFMAGEVYRNLYQHSYKSSDRLEAVDIYKRLIRKYPSSDYKRKAQAALRQFSPESENDENDRQEIKKPKTHKNGSSAKAVKASPSKSRIKLITREAEVRDSKEAYHHALQKSAQLDKEVVKLIRQESTSCPPPSKEARPPVNPSVVNGLRFWSNPNYTRIVVDATKTTRFNHQMLQQDVSNNKPQRLFIDFEQSVLSRKIKRKVPIDDDLLISARAGQCRPDTVRVVIDIKSFKTYKIFSLNNPFRTIIDVWGRDAGESYVVAAAPKKKLKKIESAPPKKTYYQAAVHPKTKMTTNDLARQLALGVRRIVVDAGHGGHDGGAPGYLKGVNEKDIVLKLAKRLARKIRKELGCEVILTRSTDRYLTLEERTAIANTKNADLFVSVHCNASKNRKAYGIETYYLNFATDEHAIQVAARENATTRKNISDLQAILNDLMQNTKINESSRLATHVQNSLHSHMKSRYDFIKNKGVKQAPFYVLIGAQMPSILVETSFISNKRECKRLTNGNYQENICNAIVNGIRNYIKETSPTVWLGAPAKAAGS